MRQADLQHREPAGQIPLTSPSIAALAEQVVRDEIFKHIDTFADKHGSGTETGGARLVLKWRWVGTAGSHATLPAGGVPPHQRSCLRSG